MRIKTFRFEDRRAGWELEEAHFDAFNLLVGASGVGKTKILDSLQRVCRAATEDDFDPGEIEWAVELEHEGHDYRWEARTELTQGGAFPDRVDVSADSNEPPQPGVIVREKIVRGEAAMVVDRRGDVFMLGDEQVPKLKKGGSAVALLESGEITPLSRGFKRILFSRAPALSTQAYRAASLEQHLAEYKRLPRGEDGFAAFRELLAGAGLSTLSRHATLAAYYLQEAFVEEFERVRSLFRDIFFSVQDLGIHKVAGPDVVRIELAIKEQGVPGWISQGEMSSGMLRTLLHLLEISLSPSGSVIVIDEFENSLGVNCMPDLTKFILSRSDCQFILTSHHPYVINNVPKDTWKLVRRKGGHVRVISARDIPELQGKSYHQAFIELINLPEFEAGIE